MYTAWILFWGIVFLIGCILVINGIGNSRKNLFHYDESENRFKMTIGMFFMVGAFVFSFAYAMLYTHENDTGAKTAQTEAIGKPDINGYPIDLADLNEGIYKQVNVSGHFAFVQRDSENPFEGSIIAVYSDKIIPQVFVIAKNPKETKRVTIKNPLLEETTP